jgi:hypothetical protein
MRSLRRCEEDAAVPFLLGHVDQVAIRGVRGHHLADVRPKAWAVGQSIPSAFSGVTMWSFLPPVVLQKLRRPRSSSRSRTPRAPAITAFEGHVWRGIEVEHQPTRLFREKELVVPGVQLQRSHLRARDQGLDSVELQVGLAAAPDDHL